MSATVPPFKSRPEIITFVVSDDSDFSILLLSVVTGCRPFAAAEAHTKTDGAGGAGERDVTSLKADGNLHLTWVQP